MELHIDTSELTRLAANSAAAGALMPAEMTRAMTRSVLKVEGDAKAIVPVDTGTLRRSITHEASATEGKVGTNVLYARYVEEGTRKMAARPYLKPALQKNMAAIIKEFAEVVKRVIATLGGG